MGEADVQATDDPERRRVFMRRVLDDVRALERMLEEGMFETGIARIGAEQEMFLIDSGQRPALKALEVLQEVDDPHFTTELAQFNLEVNLDPVVLGPNSLSILQGQLDEMLAKVRGAAARVGAEVLLTGILPTLDKSDMGIENMTPIPRYAALAKAVRELRGDDFTLHIKGRDEITLQHDSVMLEACNTSFQVHFQVAPERFASLYNLAQAVTAPVLAAATNSPLLFGRRLWKETRIAVFRQSVDTRRPVAHRRHAPPRVNFGDRWLNDSVLEIFREDIVRFRLLVDAELDEDPFIRLGAGEPPSLKALRLHNGTVYRWNRPCYGINDGKAHLRIENRILPAGPTVVDEVANAALWLGSIKALDNEIGDIRPHLRFGAAKENFLSAARLGIRAHFRWLDDSAGSATEILLTELIPRARSGLRDLGIAPDEADHYLDVVEERVRHGQTGSRWMLKSLASMDDSIPHAERLAALTAATLKHQKDGQPVHTWPLVAFDPQNGREQHYALVGSLMTTDLFTVNENDVVDLVASLMDWKHIRHVPVEDNDHQLVGLVTHRTLLRSLAEHHGKPASPIAVADVMEKDVLTVTPKTSSLEALKCMREHRVACLPVLENGRLVGILTERDFMGIAGELLEDFLRL